MKMNQVKKGLLAKNVDAKNLREAYKKARKMFKGNLVVSKVTTYKTYEVYIKPRKRRSKKT